MGPPPSGLLDAVVQFLIGGARVEAPLFRHDELEGSSTLKKRLLVGVRGTNLSAFAPTSLESSEVE